MMLFSMPIERTVCADLMLAHRAGFGEQLISGLNHILHVLLGVRFHAQEHFRRPQRRFVHLAERMRFRISRAVLCPKTVVLAVVVEMTVFMVENITAVDTEIQVARAISVLEIESQKGLAQGGETPFCLMVGIDIQNRVLAVIQMVAEVKQGVRMTQTAAHITVIPFAGFKACGLRKHRLNSCLWSHIRRIGRVLYRRRLNRSLHHSRTGRDLACCLNNRLKITLYGHAAVQRRVGLCKSRSADDQHHRNNVKT